MTTTRPSLRIGPVDPWVGRAREYTDDSVLPHASGAAGTIAIASALEHLEPSAVSRLLLESFRVLGAEGRLEIELPNFSRVMDAWRKGDARYVDERWDCLRFARGWAERNVTDDLDQRTAAIFCTYEARGYCGPAAVDPSIAATILSTKTPFRAAVDLRRAAIDREACFHFCRQNAYAVDELERTLRLTGFRLAAPARDDPDDALVHFVAEPLGGDRDLDEGAALFRRGHYEDAIARYQAAVTAAPHLAEEHYRLLYYVFVEGARGLHVGAHDEEFDRLGYRIGQLDARGVERFVRSLAAAPRSKLTIEDSAPGFVHNPDLNDKDLGEINASHEFISLGPEQLDCAAPLLEGLRAPLEACLRAPFRVVNLRCWASHARGVATQTNDWHNDEGFPADVLKVMLYLSGASESVGTTEVAIATGEKVFVLGPPGTFLIFKNYVLTHRGVMPREGERLVLEITVVPSFAPGTKPVCAGLNAEFPRVPW